MKKEIKNIDIFQFLNELEKIVEDFTKKNHFKICVALKDSDRLHIHLKKNDDLKSSFLKMKNKYLSTFENKEVVFDTYDEVAFEKAYNILYKEKQDFIDYMIEEGIIVKDLEPILSERDKLTKLMHVVLNNMLDYVPEKDDELSLEEYLDEINKLILNEKLDKYTVVKLARKDFNNDDYIQGLNRLLVDRDKFFIENKELFNELEYANSYIEELRNKGIKP